MIRETIDPYGDNYLDYGRKKPFVKDAARFLFTSLPTSDTKIFTERNSIHPKVKEALRVLGVDKVWYEKEFGKWKFRSDRIAHYRIGCHLKFQDDTVCVGRAYCSTKDSISKKSGKLLALKRALGAFMSSENV